MKDIETYLEKLNISLTEEIRNNLLREKIDYESFFLLNDKELEKLGFKMGERKKILESFRKLNVKDKNIPNTSETPTSNSSEMNQVIYNPMVKFNNGNAISGRPIKLISQEDGKLIINNDALDIIKRINGTIAICSVVGPYRTGKSFILNLLLNRPNGFDLGSTNISCTRGIWMWDTPVEHENKHGKLNLLFMDTEGLNSFDSTVATDNMIFVMSLLLSSMFVYNTTNAIDREAIRKLSVMTHLATHINSSALEDGNNRTKSIQTKMNFPEFVWVVRDVFLQNVHDTPNDYLNKALKLEDNFDEVNLIRDSIQKSFKSLSCYILPTPIESGIGGMTRDDSLKNLDKLELENLSENFKRNVAALCHHIHENIACKSLFATPLSGAAYAAYIESIVDQMNTSQQVNLVDSMLASLKNASQLTLNEAINIYEREMNEFLRANPMPLEWNKLNSKHDEIFKKSLNYLEKNLNGHNDMTNEFFDAFCQCICAYENEGKMIISSGKWSEIRKKNKEMIKKFFKDNLDKLWKELIADKYLNNNAPSENLASDFEHSFDCLKELYQNEAKFCDGPEKDEAYSEWFIEKDIKNLLLNMKHISDEIKEKIESDRKACEERGLKESAEKETKDALEQQETERKEREEYLKAIEERHENTIRELQSQIERRNEAEAEAQNGGGFLGGIVSFLTGVKGVVQTVADIISIVKPKKPNESAK